LWRLWWLLRLLWFVQLGLVQQRKFDLVQQCKFGSLLQAAAQVLCTAAEMLCTSQLWLRTRQHEAGSSVCEAKLPHSS